VGTQPGWVIRPGGGHVAGRVVVSGDCGSVTAVDLAGSGVGILPEVHDVDGPGAGPTGIYSSPTPVVASAGHFLFSAVLGPSLSTTFIFLIAGLGVGIR
jgi:hypothetical protein